MTTDQELQLIFQARQGEMQAFAQLYDYYAPKVLGYCIQRLPNREAAEDVTSTVFMKAAKEVLTFDTNRNAKFGTWIYRVTHNAVIDYYRKHNRRQHADLDQIKETLASKEVDQDVMLAKQQLVKSVLSQINERYQQVLTLKFFQQLDTDEIATILKISQAQVHVVLHRALKAFKQKYQIYDPEGASLIDI